MLKARWVTIDLANYIRKQANNLASIIAHNANVLEHFDLLGEWELCKLYVVGFQIFRVVSHEGEVMDKICVKGREIDICCIELETFSFEEGCTSWQWCTYNNVGICAD